MSIAGKDGRKISTLLSLIIAGEAIFLLPFVLARIFRPTLLQVFDISNLELGSAFSVYGLVAMAAYFFGGPLADRFPARNLMAVALWATAIGGLLMATVPTGSVLIILYGYWGFTTIFLFWAAMIKATRVWGGDGYQGRAFGFLEGGRGLTAALLATLALGLFTLFAGDVNTTAFGEQRNSSMQMVILITTAITALSGIVVWVYVPAEKGEALYSHQLPSVKKVITVLKMPVVWMQAIIIVCAYVGYKSTDDYSLYANQVLGFDEVAAAGVGTMALWMRPVFAVLAGLLADRYTGVRITIFCFALMLAGSLLIYLGVVEHWTGLTLIVLSTTLIGVYGIRGIYFALMQESAIPLAATGTAVGVMSVLGFTPDVFMSPLMGYLLDTFPGAAGHQYVFLVLALFAILGFVTSIAFRRMVLINNR
jgi:MFS transporter, GlpU family, inner membrane protein